MILVYPAPAALGNGLPCEPLERHEAHGLSLEQWLVDNVDGYERRAEPPITITVDGVLIEPDDWSEVWVERDQQIEIHPQPKEPATIIYAVVAAVVAVAASVLLRPDIPSQSNRSGSQGSKLLEANATGNRVKLGDVIPDQAGRCKRFPDYLNAPHRYFVEPKVQALDMFLCVTKGEVEWTPDEILIGNTPVTQLGQAVSFQVFNPGENVSSHPAHQIWYNAPEVGPSVGASGIRLRSDRDADASWPGTLTFDGIAITSGSGAPTGWGSGTSIDVTLPIDVAITDGGGNDIPDEFAGQFDYLMFSPGDIFTIDVRPEQTFRVIDYVGGILTMEVFANGLWQIVDGYDPGNETWKITRSDLDYEITSAVTDGFEVSARLGGSVQPGWPGFPSLTTTNATVILTSQGEEGIWSMPFAACPEGEVTRHIEVDLFSPQGLCELGETSGNIYELSRDIEIRYRPVGSTDNWVVVPKTVVGQTRDQLGWTFPIDLPTAMRPEVQMRRVNAESNSLQIIDQLEWYGLRARFDNAPTSYEGVTVLAMTITGSDLIAAQTENQVSMWSTRKLPCRENGQWTAPQATQDIAPWFAYVAKSAGYTDDDIDLVELDRLDAIWKGRGDKFCFIEADDATVKNSLIRVLRVGMAELTIDNGKLRPVRDEPRSAVEHVYSAQNMIDDFSFSVTMPRHNDTDGIDVEYVDGETWTVEEVKCRLPGDQGIKVEKVRLDGAPTAAQAYQVGMRQRCKLKYRRSKYSFRTELDALNSRYLGYNGIISDVPGEGQSMLLEAVTDIGNGNFRLSVTEPLDWSAGGDHLVAWRRMDGRMAGPYPAQQEAGEFEVLMIGGDRPPANSGNEPIHVYFGPEESFMHEVLIKQVRAKGFESMGVNAENYDSRVYLYDDSLPTD